MTLLTAVPHEIRVHASNVKGIAMEASLAHVATACLDGSVGIVDCSDFSPRYFKAHDAGANVVEFAPSAAQFLSGGGDGRVILWDAVSGVQLEARRCHELPVQRIRWSPDGKFFVTVSNDSTAAIWSAARFVQRHVTTVAKGWARGVDWRGQTIVTCGDDGHIALLDPRSARQVSSIDAHQKLLAISLSQDEQIVAVGSAAHSVLVYDLRGGKLLQEHPAHTAPVTDVAFRPGPPHVLSVGADGWARLWDLENASALLAIRTKSPLSACAWSHSGREAWLAGDERRVTCLRLEERADPAAMPCDGGDLVRAVRQAQDSLARLAGALKQLDRRLLLQEEKIQWLVDCSAVI